jgi:hypothetical protein
MQYRRLGTSGPTVSAIGPRLHGHVGGCVPTPPMVAAARRSWEFTACLMPCRKAATRQAPIIRFGLGSAHETCMARAGLLKPTAGIMLPSVDALRVASERARFPAAVIAENQRAGGSAGNVNVAPLMSKYITTIPPKGDASRAPPHRALGREPPTTATSNAMTANVGAAASRKPVGRAVS